MRHYKPLTSNDVMKNGFPFANNEKKSTSNEHNKVIEEETG